MGQACQADHAFSFLFMIGETGGNFSTQTGHTITLFEKADTSHYGDLQFYEIELSDL